MSYNYKETPVVMDGVVVNMFDGDKKVGIAAVYYVENPNRGMKWALLEDVRVEPDYRGKGIGTELVTKVIEIAKEAGCYKMVAGSRFEREGVHKWYEKMGFIKHGYDFRLDFIEVEKQA